MSFAEKKKQVFLNPEPGFPRLGSWRHEPRLGTKACRTERAVLLVAWKTTSLMRPFLIPRNPSPRDWRKAEDVAEKRSEIGCHPGYGWHPRSRNRKTQPKHISFLRRLETMRASDGLGWLCALSEILSVLCGKKPGSLIGRLLRSLTLTRPERSRRMTFLHSPQRLPPGVWRQAGDAAHS